MVAVLTVQLRHAPPKLHPPDPNHETLRSGAIQVLAPSGDVQSIPDEIRWEATAGAAQYQIRLLEVDGTELWKTDTAANTIAVPPAVRQRIVPLKTLVLEIAALDGSGRRLAHSGTIRFRLLQKVYKP